MVLAESIAELQMLLEQLAQSTVNLVEYSLSRNGHRDGVDFCLLLLPRNDVLAPVALTLKGKKIETTSPINDSGIFIKILPRVRYC